MFNSDDRRVKMKRKLPLCEGAKSQGQIRWQAALTFFLFRLRTDSAMDRQRRAVRLDQFESWLLLALVESYSKFIQNAYHKDEINVENLDDTFKQMNDWAQTDWVRADFFSFEIFFFLFWRPSPLFHYINIKNIAVHDVRRQLKCQTEREDNFQNTCECE